MVHAVTEYYNLTMTELSRIIRLGHSVKKSMWLAVVDNEDDVTYYKTGRITP
jgi:tRNA splicing endonuclease